MTTFADKNTYMRHANEYSNTLTREQRRQAKEKMVAQFAELLDRSPDENLYWMETKTDLIDPTRLTCRRNCSTGRAAPTVSTASWSAPAPCSTW